MKPTNSGIYSSFEIKEDSCGNAIQIYVQGKPILVLGNLSEFHKQTLECFLNEQEIPYEKNENDMPSEKNEYYTVAGMGLMNYIDNKMQIYGASTDYNLGINKKHLLEIKSLTDKYNIQTD